MNGSSHRLGLWRTALLQRSVLLRAVKLGFTTGLLQAAVNQGDRWLAQTVDGPVVIKTIVSPLIGFTLVLVSAAATWVEKQAQADAERIALATTAPADRSLSHP